MKTLIVILTLLATALSLPAQQLQNGRQAFSGAVNAKTATYQALTSDFNSPCVTIPVASGTFTITLVASTSQPAAGQCLDIINYGTGVVTIARSGQNLNGGTASLTVPAATATAPTGAHILSNGTDYVVTVISSPLQYRTCVFSNDTQSATALTAAQFSGNGCVIPVAATIVEVDVTGGTGVLTGSVTAPTYTGTSSVQIGKTGASSSTGLLSAALATVSGKACAQSTISQACVLNGVTSSGTVTVSTTALAVGDVLYVTAATPDTAQTWYAVTVIYKVN